MKGLGKRTLRSQGIEETPAVIYVLSMYSVEAAEKLGSPPPFKLFLYMYHTLLALVTVEMQKDFKQTIQ